MKNCASYVTLPKSVYCCRRRFSELHVLGNVHFGIKNGTHFLNRCCRHEDLNVRETTSLDNTTLESTLPRTAVSSL